MAGEPAPATDEPPADPRYEAAFEAIEAGDWAGARAASSHTASLAGDDQIYDAFFRQMGIVRIQSVPELTAFCILHRGGTVLITPGQGAPPEGA